MYLGSFRIANVLIDCKKISESEWPHLKSIDLGMININKRMLKLVMRVFITSRRPNGHLSPTFSYVFNVETKEKIISEIKDAYTSGKQSGRS